MPDSRKAPVTTKDVAAAAGAHFSTLSRARAARDLARQQIATQILETAQRLGYLRLPENAKPGWS
jgi:DNA-binding LacI/PurR family transcriptional regulator